MIRREALKWVVAFVLSAALLVVYSAPWWALAYIGVVSVLFGVVQMQPSGRLRSSRRQVLAQSAGSWVWLRFIVPMIGFGTAAVRGEGEFVVFGVLIVATLVLVLLIVQVMGLEFFDE